MTALWAQARAEVRLTARRGESVLLALGIPVALLVFLDLTKVLPPPSGTAGFLVPGLLALAVMSTGMVSLGIATAFEREYQVLKRLGATPLGRPRLVAAKVMSVAAIEVVQSAVLALVGVVLGWGPAGGAGGALAALGAAALGTAAFSGLGLVMAGRLRADAVLAGANGLWLAMLLLGGMVFPLDKLPGGLRTVADGLPAAALASTLRGTLAGSGVPLHYWLVLAAWAVVGPVAAAAAFRWE